MNNLFLIERVVLKRENSEVKKFFSIKPALQLLVISKKLMFSSIFKLRKISFSKKFKAISSFLWLFFRSFIGKIYLIH